MNTYRSRAELRRVKAWAAIVDAHEEYMRNTLGGESNYFTPETIAFWGNLWHGQPISAPYSTDAYFVESRLDDTQAEHPTRIYAVKSMIDGVIRTVSDEGEYATAEDALAAAKFVAGVL